MCLWENGKGNVLSYIGKRIERRGLSIKRRGDEREGEVGHSKGLEQKKEERSEKKKKKKKSLGERV